MTVSNPRLKFVPSEFTEGVFNAETKFGEIKIIGSDEKKFTLFGPDGFSVDVGERRPFIDAVNRATFIFGG